MFKKTLLAVATAGLVSVAALGATASTASAAPGKPWQNGQHTPGPGGNYGQGGYGQGDNFGYGNKGWYFNFDYQPPRPKPVVQKICTPTYKTVPVWKPYQGWVWQTVYNGQTCQYVPVKPHYNNW